MPVEAPLYTITQKAAASIPVSRFVDTGGVLATAAGRAFGVSRVAAEDGDNFGVHTLGTAIVEAGGVISIGDAVEVGTNGKAAAFSAGDKVGIALTASGGDGDLIEVYLIPNA